MEGERPGGQGSGDSRVEELGRAMQGVGSGSGRLVSRTGPSWTPEGVSEIPAAPPAGAEGRGPSPPEGGAAALTCALPGRPPPPPASQKDGIPRRPGAFSLPRALPRNGALLFLEGGQRCSPVGVGERGTCSTLTAEVTFPAPASGFAYHHPVSPGILEPLVFCFLFLWGTFETGMNLGRCACSGALPLWLPELRPVPAAAAG